MSIFINHRRCPTCGHHIKHYYWYCGNCGNQDLTNWAKTLIMWAVMLAIIIVAVLSAHSRLCSNTITASIVDGIAPKVLQCK